MRVNADPQPLPSLLVTLVDLNGFERKRQTTQEHVFLVLLLWQDFHWFYPFEDVNIWHSSWRLLPSSHLLPRVTLINITDSDDFTKLFDRLILTDKRRKWKKTFVAIGHVISLKRQKCSYFSLTSFPSKQPQVNIRVWEWEVKSTVSVHRGCSCLLMQLSTFDLFYF